MPVTIDGGIPKDLISLSEAAEILGMTRQAVLKQVNRGDIPVGRAGGTYVARRSVIEKLAKARHATA